MDEIIVESVGRKQVGTGEQDPFTNNYARSVSHWTQQIQKQVSTLSPQSPSRLSFSSALQLISFASDLWAQQSAALVGSEHEWTR